MTRSSISPTNTDERLVRLRLICPLASITWEQIEAVAQMEDGLLEARVEGSGSASVPLLGEGWTVHKMHNV